jgi:hypothetical protein
VAKLRYLMPAALLVAGSGGVGAVLYPAGNALASSHRDTCSGSFSECLWYSAGTGSAIWASEENCVRPDFSDDKSCGSAPARKDLFYAGTGSGKVVRNDAHSFAECSPSFPGYLYVSPNFTGSVYELGANHCGAVTLPNTKPHNLRNNEASYESGLVK